MSKGFPRHRKALPRWAPGTVSPGPADSTCWSNRRRCRFTFVAAYALMERLAPQQRLLGQGMVVSVYLVRGWAGGAMGREGRPVNVVECMMVAWSLQIGGANVRKDISGTVKAPSVIIGAPLVGVGRRR